MGMDRILSGRTIGWLTAGFGLVGLLICLLGFTVLMRSRDSAGPHDPIV